MPRRLQQGRRQQCTYHGRYQRHRRSWSARGVEMQGQEHHRQEDRRCVTVKQLDQLSPSHFHPPENARYTCCEVDTRRRQSSTWTGHCPKIGQKSNG